MNALSLFYQAKLVCLGHYIEKTGSTGKEGSDVKGNRLEMSIIRDLH
jgi:hypothetical protein